MKTLLLSLLVLSQVVFGCGLPTELDDSDCGIIYMGSWEAIEGGYHITPCIQEKDIWQKLTKDFLPLKQSLKIFLLKEDL